MNQAGARSAGSHRPGSVRLRGHLLHPPAIGLRVDPGDVHTAGLQLDHEDDEIPPQTGPCETSTVKRSAAARPSKCVCRNVFQGVRWFRSGAGASPWSCKIRLTVFRAMLWPRLASAPRIRRVAPRRILTRHPCDEFGHRPGCHRSSPTPASTAIVLLGDQTPVPAENRVRRDDAYHLTQDPPAECLAAHPRVAGAGRRSDEAVEDQDAPGGRDSPSGDSR